MHLLAIVPYYAPDLGPSAPLFTMLSEKLVQRGHRVTVITSVPHYPSGQVPASYRGKLIWRSSEQGVEVVRVALPSLKRGNLACRLLQFLSYQIGATLAGLGLEYDAVFVANPALMVWLPFVTLVSLRRKVAIFSIHDLYPEIGIRLGIFRHQPVIAAVAALERYCLKHAAVVRILADSFRPGLRALGVPDEKMELIYDWVDTELIHPLPRNNAFAREHELVDPFVVLYAGNIGLSQGLEHFLTAADLLRAHPDMRFVLVGEGGGREQLVREAVRRQLANVAFLPFQPRQRLAEVLASADVSMVILKRGVGADSLPSKTYSIMASGRPILASVDEGSETWKLIQRANAGLCIPPENPEEMAAAILALKQDQELRKRLGANGRTWAEQHHSPASAAEQFEHIFRTRITKEPRLAISGDAC